MNNLYVSGNASALYPADTLFGLLWTDREDVIEIPKRYPFQGEWGQVLSTHILENQPIGLPSRIDIVWLSIVERIFYSAEYDLPTDTMRKLLSEGDYSHVVVGMGYGGIIAVWLYGDIKSRLLVQHKCSECDVEMQEFLPFSPTTSLENYCHSYIEKNMERKKNIEKNGLPPCDLFDNYMKQFTFRYQVAFEKWNGEKWEKYKEDEATPEFNYIEEALFDGTHDKLHDGGLMKYHEAGKPKKLKVQFHKGKTEYSAYFWFEDERIREVFDKFYGAHPDTKTDFIIKIDAEKNKYQVALYRYGLKEPVVLADDVYQLIVFRNKFECYRSENYNQPRGAWIW